MTRYQHQRVLTLTALVCLLGTLLVVSCKDDEAAIRVPTTLGNTLLSQADLEGARAYISYSTTVKEGLRPKDWSQVDELPSAFTHRLIPKSETWYTELAFFSDGTLRAAKKRTGDNARTPGVRGWMPGDVMRWEQYRDGRVEGLDVSGDVIQDGAVGEPFALSNEDLAILLNYRRIPKDSVLMALAIMDDAWGGPGLVPRDGENFAVEVVNEEVAMISCNGPGHGHMLQAYSVEEQVPRVVVHTFPGSVEYSQTMYQFEFDANTDQPQPFREEARFHIDPDRTGGVATYSFEEVTFSGYNQQNL